MAEVDPTPTEERLRQRHRERMGAWGLPTGDEYEHEVVQRALAALRGERERPYLHSHALSELGACHECDAAALLENED